jgi:hypothetical protein
MANITKASSPLVAIIVETITPKDINLLENSETAVNAPRQPGITPSNAATMYCFHLFPNNCVRQRPFV